MSAGVSESATETATATESGSGTATESATESATATATESESASESETETASAGASAPGKLILAGEYAVLRGAAAIVAAIDRRAIARPVDDPGELSPFLAEVAARLGREPGSVRVDTARFYEGGRKLGLGSSAAATVAFAGALAPEVSRDEIFAIALAAHGEVSARGGARGSGIDVAASTYGGVIRATPAGSGLDVAPLALPDELVLVAVDSGAPADTRDLVRRVMSAAGDADLEALAAAADTLGAATDPGAAIAAIAAGMRAVEALAAATGVALITPALARIAELAAARGGAAKPTGAAGGDVAIAAFANEEDARQFRDDLASAGITALDLAFDPHGLLQMSGPDGMVPGY
jgi:phosphomevalonate kinase